MNPTSGHQTTAQTTRTLEHQTTGEQPMTSNVPKADLKEQADMIKNLVEALDAAVKEFNWTREDWIDYIHFTDVAKKFYE